MEIAETIPFHCLICTQKEKEKHKSEFAEASENESLFNFVCKSLKIKLTKRNSWNFKKEVLPFCSSCTDISKDLLQTEEQIRVLETHFQEKLEELKSLIINSDNDRPEDKKSQDNSEDEDFTLHDDDARFLHFRSQITGTRITGRKSNRKTKTTPARRKSSPSPVTVSKTLQKESPRKTVIANALEEEEDDEEKSPGRRRSLRKKKKPRFIDNSESEDPERTDHENFSDCGPLENSNADEQIELEIPLELSDLKYEVVIKSEIESEVEGLESFQEDQIVHLKQDNKPSISNTLSEGESSPRRRIRKPIVRKKRKMDGSEEEDNSDDSDFRLENSETDEEEEETSGDEKVRSEPAIYRKWKTDKKAGKMWYNGIEVISVKNGLKCSKCDEIIEGDKKHGHKVKVKRHIMLKHMEKFNCVLCDKVLSCKKYLDMHVKMVHEKSVIILCKICEKPFTSQNAMRRHAWNHQNEAEKQAAIAAGKKQYGIKKMESLQCGQCGKMCKGPYNLKRHEETHIDQKDRMKHMCQICGGLYSAPETLRSHIKLVHENNNQLQWLKCPHCPKKYPQPGRLEKHMRSHTGDKPYVCSTCGACFSQLTLLKVHMLKHKNLRPHKCEFCEMSFFRRYHMQRHTQIYHESEKPPTKKQPYRSENGTRKAPQKRERKKTPNVVEVLKLEMASPIVEASPCDPVAAEPQQIIEIVGALGETPQNFSFSTGNTCYPFYTFTPSSSIHQ